MPRTPSRRRAPGIGAALIAAVVAAALLGLEATPAGAALRCSAPGSRTVAQTRLVRVYKVPVNRYISRLVGCLRRSGRTMNLHGDADYPPAIAGTWVARAKEEAARSDEDWWLYATDLRTGRTHDFNMPDEDGQVPQALAVSTRGTLAWLVDAVAPTLGDAADFAVLPAIAGGPPRIALLDGGISIAQRRSDGSFADPTRVMSATRLGDVLGRTVRDLDGDGVADLVLTTRSGVAIVPGLPDGSFAAPRRLPIAGKDDYGAVTAGDLDRDGHLDIVASGPVTGRGPQQLWVLRGRGGFAFDPPSGISVPESLGGLTVADVDGDGAPDVLAGDVQLLLHGNGDGTLAAPATLGTTEGILTRAEVGDFNRDGIPDIVYGEDPNENAPFRGGGVRVLIGRGSGQFAPPVLYMRGFAMSPLVGDVTGDGILDIVSAYSLNFGITVEALVLKGRGDGTFDAPKSPDHDDVGNDDYLNRLADVDGDGKLDLVVEDEGEFEDLVTMLRGRGDGTFAGTQPGYDLLAVAKGKRLEHRIVHGGRIAPDSLRFRGGRLRWTVAGRHASERMR